MRALRAWDGFWGALGFLRRNRRQRKAAAAKRRSMYRRHVFDTLEQRVVLNADPIAADDEHQLSSAYVSTANYGAVLDNDTDADGDRLGLRYDGNPNQSVTLNPGDTYLWDYAISDGHGTVDLGQVRLTADGTPNANATPTVYVHQTAAGEQQGSVTVSVRLTQPSQNTISVDWQTSSGSAVLDQDYSSGNWREGYYADEMVWRESGYPTYTDVWHDTSGYVMQPVHHPEGRWITESVWHEGEYVVEPVWHDDYTSQEVWHDGYYADEPVWHEAGNVIEPVWHPETYDEETQTTIPGYYADEEVWYDGRYITESVWHPPYSTWENVLTGGHYENEPVWHPGYYADEDIWQSEYWIDEPVWQTSGYWGPEPTGWVDTSSWGTESVWHDGEYVQYGTLMFQPGEVEKQLTFWLSQDSEDEGDETFLLTLNNGSGANIQASTGSVTILDDDHNYAPIVLAESYQIAEDATLDVTAEDGVMRRAIDFAGESFTAVLQDGPLHGTLTLAADGSFTYTPATNYFGTDSFSYTAIDASGNVSTSAVVTLNVMPVADVPIAVDDVITVAVDTPVTFTPIDNDIDADDDDLSVDTLRWHGQHGDVTLHSNGSFTYAPDPGYIGLDKFEYDVTDGQTSSRATVWLEIGPLVVGTADDLDLATSEETPLELRITRDHIGGVLSTHFRVSSSAGTFYAGGTPVDSQLGFEFESSGGLFTFLPDVDFFGPAEILVQAGNIVDGAFVSLAGPESFIVEVHDVFDQPTITVENLTVDESAGQVVIKVRLSSESPVPVEVDWALEGLTASHPNDYAGTWLAESWTETVAIPGYDVIETRVQDVTTYYNNEYQVETGSSIVGYYVISIRDSEGVVVSQSFYSPGDSVDPSWVDFTSDIQPTYTTFAAGSQSSTGGPDSAWTAGYYSITQPASVSTSYHVDREEPDPVWLDPPFGVTYWFMSAPRTEEVEHDGRWETVGDLAGKLRFEAGTVERTIVVHIEDDLINEATESFRVRLDNPVGAKFDAASIQTALYGTITITDDDAPGARSDAYEVLEDATLDVATAAGVLANDRAAAGYGLSAGLINGPSHGSLVLAGDGGFVYTPEEDFYGTDSFTYSIPGVTDAATVTITVRSVNDAPSFDGEGNVIASAAADEITIATWAQDMFAGADNEGDQNLVFELEVATAEQENLFAVLPTIAADGTLRFTPSGAIGTATVGVRLRDNGGPANGGVDFVEKSFTINFTAPVETIDRGEATASIEIGNVVVDESAGVALFTVTLIGQIDHAVGFNWSTHEDTADANDFIAAAGVIKFLPGETTKTIAVTLTDDDRYEDRSQSFGIVLSTQSGVMDKESRDAAGTIEDDEPLPVLSISGTGAKEDGKAVFTITLSGATEKEVTVDFATQDGAANAYHDYNGTGGTATFAPSSGGTQTYEFEVVLRDDHKNESDEKFSVTLMGAVNAEIGDGEAEVTIEDLKPTPRIEGVSTTVIEGASLRLRVVLDRWVDTDTTVQYAVHGGSAPGGTVVVKAGVLSEEFEISTLPNAIVDDGYEFNVGIAGQPLAEAVRCIVTDDDGESEEDESDEGDEHDSEEDCRHDPSEFSVQPYGYDDYVPVMGDDPNFVDDPENPSDQPNQVVIGYDHWQVSYEIVDYVCEAVPDVIRSTGSSYVDFHGIEEPLERGGYSGIASVMGARSVNESDGKYSVNIEVTVLGQPTSMPEIAYRTIAGSAEVDKDFTAVSPWKIVTLSAGSNTLEIDLTDDNLPEGDERFIVEIATPPQNPLDRETGINFLVVNKFDVDIVDDDDFTFTAAADGVAVDDDDDNENGITDLFETPTVSSVQDTADYVKLSLALPFDDGDEGAEDYSLKVTLSSNNVTLWQKSGGQLAQVASGTTWQFGASGSVPSQLYVRGVSGGWATVTASLLKATGVVESHDIDLFAYQVDIDAYDASFSSTNAESKGSDPISEVTSGALGRLNVNDTDGDATVDSSDDDVRPADEDGRLERDLVKLLVRRPILPAQTPDLMTDHSKWLKLSISQGTAKLWAQPWKGTPLLVSSTIPLEINPWTIPEEGMVLWAETEDGGDANRRFSLSYGAHEDTVTVTAAPMILLAWTSQEDSDTLDVFSVHLVDGNTEALRYTGQRTDFGMAGIDIDWGDGTEESDGSKPNFYFEGDHTATIKRIVQGKVITTTFKVSIKEPSYQPQLPSAVVPVVPPPLIIVRLSDYYDTQSYDLSRSVDGVTWQVIDTGITEEFITLPDDASYYEITSHGFDGQSNTLTLPPSFLQAGRGAANPGAGDRPLVIYRQGNFSAADEAEAIAKFTQDSRALSTKNGAQFIGISNITLVEQTQIGPNGRATQVIVALGAYDDIPVTRDGANALVYRDGKRGYNEAVSFFEVMKTAHNLKLAKSGTTYTLYLPDDSKAVLRKDGDWGIVTISRPNEALQKIEFTTPIWSLRVRVPGSPDNNEIDAIENRDTIVEWKDATGMFHPMNRNPDGTFKRDEVIWATKHVYQKIVDRIQTINNATDTFRGANDLIYKGPDNLPPIELIKSIRKFKIQIDGDWTALKTAVNTQVQRLTSRFGPDGYTFVVEFGA